MQLGLKTRGGRFGDGFDVVGLRLVDWGAVGKHGRRFVVVSNP